MTIHSSALKPLLALLLLGVVACQGNRNTPCELKWNRAFTAGEIGIKTIQKDIPIGSNVKQLERYIKKYRIPPQNHRTNTHKDGCSESVFYTAKLRGGDLADFLLDHETLEKVAYSIELHGHELSPNQPEHYYHPILYFYFDSEDGLVAIKKHGYP